MIYKHLVRPALFALDSETVHDSLISLAHLAGLPGIYQSLRALFDLRDEKLKVKVAGLEFPNRLGLAAGFDKNCRAAWLFEALGFGHIEFGTVTSQAQPGNPKPRIFRLPADQALINRMGFPSEGSSSVGSRLRSFKSSSPNCRIGVNLGKLKNVGIDQAAQDYLECFKALKGLGDYYVLNVSSPNTPELRKLQERDRLEQLFKMIAHENTENSPLFVKIAPDLGPAELDQILELCLGSAVSGIIATNTTLSRAGLKNDIDQPGGLSGAPLNARSLEVVRFIAQRVGTKLAIIGVGGISSFDQVKAMLDAGASLVQVYTALIYEGPGLIKKIKQECLRSLQ